MPRIDAHAHILPPDYRAQLERRDLMSFPLPPWSADLLDALMARHAIDAAVISLSPPGVFFGDQGLADELARLVNERTAEHVRGAPDRFAGLAVLPLPNVDRALAELRNALRPFWGANVPIEPRTVTRQGRMSAAIAMATRRLSTVPLADSGERGALLRSIGARMTSNCRAVADALEQGRTVALEPVDALLARLGEMDAAEGDGRVNQTVSLLADMDAIVRELGARAEQ